MPISRRSFREFSRSPRAVRDGVGIHSDSTFDFEFVGGVLEGVVGGVVGAEFGIEVSQDSDANGVTHALIVLNRRGTACRRRLEDWCRVKANG